MKIKNLFSKQNVSPSNSNWRDSFKSSGYGLKVETPSYSKKQRVCTHLDVSEKTRSKLQSFLIKNWTSKSEYLVDEFLNICHKSNENPIFPPEIKQLLVSRHQNTLTNERLNKEIVATYIRHEINALNSQVELDKIKKQNIKKVKIRTSEDQRVCPTCQKHRNKTYTLSKAPVLPACWECRCYYEPII